MINFKTKKIDYHKLKLFLFPALLIFLIIFSTFSFIMPKINEGSRLMSTIKKKESRLSQLTEKLSLLKSLNQVELTERSGLSLKALPENKKPVFIMNALSKVSAGTGVQVGGINVQPGEIATVSAKTKKGTPFLTFPIKAFGTQDNVINFIKRLEKVLPLLRIEEISINIADQENLWEISTEINAYYLFLPETIGAIDSPVQVITKEEGEVFSHIKGFTSISVDETLPTEAGRENPFL